MSVASPTSEAATDEAEPERTLTAAEIRWSATASAAEREVAADVLASALRDDDVAAELEEAGLEPDAVAGAIEVSRLTAAGGAAGESFRVANLESLESHAALWHAGHRSRSRQIRSLLPLIAGAALGASSQLLSLPSPWDWIRTAVAVLLIVTGVAGIVVSRLEMRRARRIQDAMAAARAAAERDYRRAVRERGVREELRALRNLARRWTPDALKRFNEGAGLTPDGDVRSAPRAEPVDERPLLRPLKADGLAEIAGNDWEVPTTAMDEARRLLQTMPGGTIGIAGPRGAGKTTLLRSLYRENESSSADASTRLPGISVMVTAPVAYEPPEFVRMLFAGACNKVVHRRESGTAAALDPRASAPQYPLAASVHRATRLLLRNGPLDAGVAVAAVGTVLLLNPDLPPLRTVVAWGALLLGYGLIALGLLRRQERSFSRRGADDPELRLRISAQDHLDDLRFQRKTTRGLKARVEIAKAAGLQLEESSSHELARRELTYAEVVSGLRSFLEECATSRREMTTRFSSRAEVGSPRVIVAIDELDKLSSIEGARSFMNELKALFGISDCFFLISISEDAMASFETRGLPFRDVFDSSLDEVIGVRPLAFTESRDLLFRRIEALDLPFVALLHCISGGIPRDLVRHARALVLLSAQHPAGIPMNEVCAAVVRRELRDKGAGLIAAVRAVPYRETPSRVLALAERLRTSDATAEALGGLRVAVRAPGLAGEVAVESGETDESVMRLARIVRELDGFVYFLETLIEVFDEQFTEAQLLRHEEAPDPRAHIDHLAHARQAFAAGSGLAVAMIDDWRAARARLDAGGAARPVPAGEQANGAREPAMLGHVLDGIRAAERVLAYAESRIRVRMPLR